MKRASALVFCVAIGTTLPLIPVQAPAPPGGQQAGLLCLFLEKT